MAPGPRNRSLGWVMCSQSLPQQRQQVCLLLLHLIERALPWRLVRAPAQQARAMPETLAGKVVVAHLDHKLRLERLPFARALGRPAARTARRVAGETRRRDQSFQLLGQRRLVLALDARTEADVMQQALPVVQPEQQRADQRR